MKTKEDSEAVIYLIAMSSRERPVVTHGLGF